MSDFPVVAPTLNLDFANSRQLDPRITFRRSSTGTYVDSDGLIKTANIDQPRFDHDPVTGVCKGLLVEESRTNLLTYSEDFTQSVWTKGTTLIATNSALSPNNTYSATLLIPNLGSFNIHSATSTSGTHTSSIFVKDAGAGSCLVAMGSTTQGYLINLNTVTGTYISGRSYGGGTLVSYSILPYPNGWFKVSVTATANARGVYVNRADGTSPNQGIYIWGAQLEAGSFPTSYIPTTGATVTRSADVASMTGANFSSWYNQGEGSFVLSENNSFGAGLNKRLEINQDSSPNANAIAFTVNYGNGTRITTRDSNSPGTLDVTLTNVWTQGGTRKYGYGLQLNNSVIVSGSSIITDTACTLPPNLNSFSFGAPGRAVSLVNDAGKFTISRITYWPKRLPNSQLIALTRR